MGFQNSITGGQGTLERPAIKSQNYAAGVSGWSINRDGSAEFNNLTVRGGTTVGGVFLEYNGTPALGNLVFSIAPSAGTDVYGNHYSSGIVAYKDSLTSDVALQSGRLKFGNAQTDFVNSALVYQNLTAGGDLRFDTGTGDSTHLDRVRGSMIAGQGGKTTGDAACPQFNLIDGLLTSDVDQYISGSVIKTDKSGNPYTWQTVGGGGGAAAFKANWVTSGSLMGLGGPGLQYKLMPDDSVWIYGLCHANAGAGSVIFTLPSGYYPTTKGSANMGNANGTLVNYAINTANGDVIVNSVIVGADYLIDARIPLRNVA